MNISRGTTTSTPKHPSRHSNNNRNGASRSNGSTSSSFAAVGRGSTASSSLRGSTASSSLVSPPAPGGVSESEYKRRFDELSTKYFSLVETNRNLKDDFRELESEVEEHKRLRLDIAQGGTRVKGGKNSTRKHQGCLFTQSDLAMREILYTYYQAKIWPHVKVLPMDWEKWEEDKRSLCQRIMTKGGIAVPRTYSKEQYWTSVVRSMINMKKQSLHSGVMTHLRNEFKDDWIKSSNTPPFSDYSANEELFGDVYRFILEEESPAYEDLAPFLRFIDRYAIAAVGKQELANFLKDNKDSSILDLLQPSDVAYTIVCFEMKRKEWTKMMMTNYPPLVSATSPSADNDVGQEALSTAGGGKPIDPSSYFKSGACIKTFRDGWTAEGKRRIEQLTSIFRTAMKGDFWNELRQHWDKYSLRNNLPVYAQAVPPLLSSSTENQQEVGPSGIIYLPDDNDDDDIGGRSDEDEDSHGDERYDYERGNNDVAGNSREEV